MTVNELDQLRDAIIHLKQATKDEQGITDAKIALGILVALDPNPVLHSDKE